MKKQTKIFFALLTAVLLAACSNDGYRLMWAEHFNGRALDTTVWRKLPRGASDWDRHMSPHPALYDVHHGKLLLRGRVNDIDPQDTASVITGGVRTIGGFHLGKIEIRARLGEAVGAWPAFWMLPVNGTWPDGGEIDIMEHLNRDSIAYQTTHTHFTYTLKRNREPKNGGRGPIRPRKYNVYSVEITPDSLVYAINGRHTITYPRVPGEEHNGQFPFAERPFYLLLDMQLGGSWVGKIDTSTLPVEMQIDWVKYWKKKD